MAGIVVENVTKSFGDTKVLRGVSLSVAEGEFVSLVGPSGCGKTTLMRIIAGLETVTSGEVSISARQVTRLRAADRDVAMVFQNYALYPHLTVRQNMAVPLVMRRLTTAERLPFAGYILPSAKAKRADIQTDVTRAAELLAIDGLMDRKPAQLSGGQRQRVALGRAIVRKPSAFLMDEPLSNLDAALRVTTRTEIVALHRRVGASTVYVTHDQSEAMTMSDRIAVMMQGELLQVATPEEIYANPVDLRVARFIGSPAINQISADVSASGVVEVQGQPVGLVSPARGPVVLTIRPEDLTLGSEGLAGTVEHVEFLGESVLLHARLGGGELVIARVVPSDRAHLGLGRPVRLALRLDRAMLFATTNERLACAPTDDVANTPINREAVNG